jgi:hypothetical protein
MWLTRFTVAAAAILALSGCIAPAPYYSSYPAYGYGYGSPGYYGPAYVAGPTISIGGGGGRGHWR